jgi:20S proteasome subunit alpha 6
MEPSSKATTTDHIERSNKIQQQQQQVHQADAQEDQNGAERKLANKSLEAASAESTLLDLAGDGTEQSSLLLDMDTQVEYPDGERDDGGEATQLTHDQEDHEPDHDPDFEEHEHEQDHEQMNAAGSTQLEHLPEPPASPISNTLLSTPNSDTGANVMKAESSAATAPGGTVKARVPSANRISISYAGGNRRLVIDAEVVQSMKVLRQAGMIEVLIDVIKLNENELKGILVSLPPPPTSHQVGFHVGALV